jgi:hypothetical protein
MFRPLSRYPGAAPYNPIALFPQGGGVADGWLYNHQDLSTLWQDQKGTVCTGPNQRVCMVRSLAHDQTTRGSELVVNGAFPADVTGWAQLNSVRSWVAPGVVRITNSGAAVGYIRQVIATEVGRTYEIKADLITNANGAALWVGTANADVTMLNVSWAAGATETGATYQFIARTTTTFVQVATNSATSGHFTDWDNISVKLVGGRHMIQPDASKQPILRQHALGYYYIEADDSARVIGGAQASTTSGGVVMAPDAYMAGVFTRDDTITAANISIFTAGLNTSNYQRIGTTAGLRLRTTIRDGGATSGFTLDLPAGVMGNDLTRSVDSLIVSGSFDCASNRYLPAPLASAAFAGFNGTGPFMFGSANNAYGIATGGGKVGGWMWCNQNPGVNRAGIRAWFANLMLAD